mgnify:CR=1 FL=1
MSKITNYHYLGDLKKLFMGIQLQFNNKIILNF